MNSSQFLRKRMTFTTFLQLPDKLVAGILSNLLGGRSIGRLDSAFCAKEARPTFLGLLSSEAYLLKNCIPKASSIVPHFNWCVARGVKGNVLKWTVEVLRMDKTVLATFALLNCNSIDTIVVKGSSTNQWCQHFQSIQKLLLYDAVTDLDVISIADSFPMLTEIRLMHAAKVTDAGVEHLCSKCAQLVSLRISGSEYITNKALQSIDTHLSGTLRHLYLDYCEKISSFKQLKKCSLLETLDICTSLGSHSGPLDNLFANLKQLRVLCLDGRALDNAALFTLARNCTHLRELSMLGCTGYAPTGIAALAQHTKQLKILQIKPSALSAKARETFERNGCQVGQITYVDSYESDNSDADGDYGSEGYSSD